MSKRQGKKDLAYMLLEALPAFYYSNCEHFKELFKGDQPMLIGPSSRSSSATLILGKSLRARPC
jgi:hypothetical protein